MLRPLLAHLAFLDFMNLGSLESDGTYVFEGTQPRRSSQPLNLRHWFDAREVFSLRRRNDSRVLHFYSTQKEASKNSLAV